MELYATEGSNPRPAEDPRLADPRLADPRQVVFCCAHGPAPRLGQAARRADARPVAARLELRRLRRAHVHRGGRCGYRRRLRRRRGSGAVPPAREPQP
eukprot:scaffold19386_cov68-Phaeocystis_antarctica.AAC.6